MLNYTKESDSAPTKGAEVFSAATWRHFWNTRNISSAKKNYKTEKLLLSTHQPSVTKLHHLALQHWAVLTCVTQLSFPATWTETSKWINFIDTCPTVLARFPKTVVDIYNKKSAVIAQGSFHLLRGVIYTCVSRKSWELLLHLYMQKKSSNICFRAW